MNTQATIEAVERLLTRKQSVPSQMTRDLLVDLKAYKALVAMLQKKIAELEAKPTEAVQS